MTNQEEIKDWLNTPDQEKDFQKGINLLSQNSKNRCMINMVERKKNLPALVYQVKKLIGIHLIPSGSPDIAVRELKAVKTNAPAHKSAGKLDLPTDDHVIIERKYENVKRESLPENLQQIHDKIAEAYKYQRVYHEKMKLAKTDEQRAELRAKDIEYDDIIAKGWDAIDSFLKDGTGAEHAKEKTTLDISRDINAARSYITKNIRALNSLPEKKKAIRIADIKKRVDVLINTKAPVKQETFNALIQSGIISESSGLVVETR